MGSALRLRCHLIAVHLVGSFQAFSPAPLSHSRAWLIELRAWLRPLVCMQGKQLEIAGASGLLSVSVQPADPSAMQAAQRARHMLATSTV